MYIKRPSKVVSFSGSWRDLAWSSLYNLCKEEQEIQIETAREVNKTKYAAYLEEKEAEEAALNPEGGSYEGNLSDKYPFIDLSAEKIFKIRRAASNKVVEDFVKEKQIKSFAVPLMQSILKFLSEFKLTTISGEAYDPKVADLSEDGLISANRLRRQVFTDDTMLGLYNFLMIDTRSCYLDKQYQTPSRAFCALVPLIMYAFKLHKGIPYSHWHRDEIACITNPKLADAMLYELDEPFTKSEIMSAREEGLLIKSGPTEGQKRNPVYTFKLFGAKLFAANKVPELAQTMYAQIWCAHPNNRTKYMVLDPSNWDSVPAPLITSEVISTIADISYSDTSNTKSKWDSWDA